MTFYKHELKQGCKLWLIWTAAVALMLFICMLMYPEMASQMDGISELFASMGGFTSAFGMDKLSFGTVMGFYGIEGGNILGIGGSFFAALLGAGLLSKEETGHTAEFVFTHPVGRAKILSEKLLAGFTQIGLLNGILVLCAAAAFGIIGEELLWKEFLLFHLAQLIMQLEIFSICFGLSSFLRKGSAGVGLGIAAIFYFLNIVANISGQAEFLKYITPFQYAEASDIFTTISLEGGLVALGILYSAVFIAFGYFVYLRKDLHA